MTNNRILEENGSELDSNSSNRLAELVDTDTKVKSVIEDIQAVFILQNQKSEAAFDEVANEVLEELRQEKLMDEKEQLFSSKIRYVIDLSSGELASSLTDDEIRYYFLMLETADEEELLVNFTDSLVDRFFDHLETNENCYTQVQNFLSKFYLISDDKLEDAVFKSKFADNRDALKDLFKSLGKADELFVLRFISYIYDHYYDFENLEENYSLKSMSLLEDEVIVEEDEDGFKISHKVFKNMLIMSGGDENIMRILKENVNYHKGSLSEPRVKDGIPFWTLGHNSSHQFSIGCKDGQFYKYSIGEYGCPKCDGEGCDYSDESENCMNGIEYREHITKIDGDDWGYCGHY